MIINSPSMSMNAVIMSTASRPKADVPSCSCCSVPCDGLALLLLTRWGQSVLPRAAGATLRPTTPASATMVSTYGIISTNWLGTAWAPCS